MGSIKRNNAEKIINLLLNALIFIFGIVLLISIYTSVQTRILGNDYTNFFGYSVFEVQTGSMAGTIDAGDWIVVKLTQKVKLNDIVTYKLDDEYITHRVIEVYNETYTTKGDANNAKDEPIKQNQIVGKVINVMANFGLFRTMLYNSTVMVALIITFFLFNLAFRKNKNESSNTMTTRFNKEINKYFPLDYIAKKISPVLNLIVKSIRAVLNAIGQTLNTLLELVMKFISNNRPRKTKNNKLNKAESDEAFIRRVMSSEVDNRFKGSDREDENSKNKEDDLDKTKFYRVVSVDANEVDDETKEETKKVEKIEKAEYDENDLDKTIFYRVVSVDANEVDNETKEVSEKTKNDENKEGKVSLQNAVSLDTIKVEDKISKKIEEEELKEDDLDKTALFRVIPVDSSEIDNTFLEIADNELKKAEKEEKNKKKAMDVEMNPEENIVEEETLTEINLDMLKDEKGHKKGKNIIDSAMIIKKEELNELIDILIEDDKRFINKATIKDAFITAYIDARYYVDIDVKHRSKNSSSKIERTIKEVASELINDYHGNNAKYKDTVDIYATTFILIASLENAWDSITDIKAKTEFYKKEIIKYSENFNGKKIESVISEIMKVQRNYIGTLGYFMEKLETSMFNLSFNKLSTKKDMYGLELSHNIEFSKVYSEYIIDKTYTEGIVAEDKMSVLLTLLSVQLIKDMVASDFNKQYILYVPTSLFTKEHKLMRLLNGIDDRYAKNNVLLLLTFEDLLKNKKIVTKIRRMGYKFALVFDKETVIEEKNRGNMYIADYIFINKEDPNIDDILPLIPNELLGSVIYEDVVNKVGDLGSE